MFHSVEGSASHMTFWLKGFSLLVVFEKGFVEDKKFGMQHVVALFDADLLARWNLVCEIHGL